MADVVVEIRAKGADFLGGSADELGRKAELDETREVADQEHHAIADQADAGEEHQVGAEIGATAGRQGGGRLGHWASMREWTGIAPLSSTLTAIRIWGETPARKRRTGPHEEDAAK